MQSVSLHDIITVTPITSGIELSCDDPNIPLNEQNICYKAAKLALRSGGVKIHIEKRIPIAAGLAGGSADAAAVLYALNAPEFAAQVGSDVPFCLTGGTCLVKGRGEIVEKVDPWPQQYYIIINPGIHISAKWAYDAFDNLNIVVPDGIKNDLEPAVTAKYPVILEIKEKLLKLGCVASQMSGSGSTVFGLVKDLPIAQMIYEKIKADYDFCCLAQNKNQGIEVIEK
jgi:4-diphosphocytidyl-2-C-methyl-D-erythritol kinase